MYVQKSGKGSLEIINDDYTSEYLFQVGFANYYILDNGRTVHTGSLRVASGYQGHGINQRMTEHMDREIRAQYPDINAKAEVMIRNEGGDRRIAKLGYKPEYIWVRIVLLLSIVMHN